MFYEGYRNLPIHDQITILGERLCDVPWRIAIDGPGAGGKGTVSKLLSHTLNLEICPTGDMYRAITYYLTEIEHLDQTGIKELTDFTLASYLKNFSVDFQKNGDTKTNIRISYGLEPDITTKDIFSDELQASGIKKNVSAVAKRNPMRDIVDTLSLPLFSKGRMVIEGRDMWKIAKDADLLIYLYARDDVLIAREIKRQKENNTYLSDDQAAETVIQRNKDDNNRERGKLLTPQEAQESGVYDLIIDTSDMTPEQILFVVLEKLATTIANDRKT